MLWQTPFLLNHLGKEMYGVWILSNTLLSYFALCSFGFLHTFLVEYTRLGNDSPNKLYNNTFFSISLLYLFSTLLYFGFGVFCVDLFELSPENASTFRSIYNINFITYSFNYFIGFYLGVAYWVKKWIHLKNFFEMLTIAGNSIAIYLFLGKLNLPVVWLYCYQAGFAFALLLTYIILLRNEVALRFDLSFFTYFKERLKTSLHFFLLNATNLFVFLGDNLLISVLAGVSNLPFYSISFRISDYSIKIIRKIIEVKGPELASNLKKEDRKSFVQLYKKTILASGVMALIATFCIILLGQNLLKWWIGDKIIFDYSIIIVFAIYIPISVTMHVNWVVLNILGKHKVLSYVVVVEVIMNIILSICLQRKFGLIGFGFATLLSTFVCSWWYSFFKVRKELKKLNRSSEAQNTY